MENNNNKISTELWNFLNNLVGTHNWHCSNIIHGKCIYIDFEYCKDPSNKYNKLISNINLLPDGFDVELQSVRLSRNLISDMKLNHKLNFLKENVYE